MKLLPPYLGTARLQQPHIIPEILWKPILNSPEYMNMIRHNDIILHLKRHNQINITDKAVNNHPRSRQMTIRLIRRIAQLPANSRKRSNQRVLIDSNKIPSRRLIIMPNRPPAIMRTKRPIKKPLLNITRIKPLLTTKRLLIITTKSLLTMRAKMLLTIKLTFRHGSDLKVNSKILK